MPIGPDQFERNRKECLEIVERLKPEIEERGGFPVVRSTGFYTYIEIYTSHDLPQEDVKVLMDEMYDRIPDNFIAHSTFPKPGTYLPEKANNR